MPKEKDLKRNVRQRMAVTGERYTDARAAIVDPPAPPDRRGRQTERRTTSTNSGGTAERWVELLADPQQNQGAYRLLKQLPPDKLRPLAVAGTRHANPKVRRRSCQLLDDLALTRASIEALEACATDPDPRVRAAALHTLACEHCKPDGVCLDQRVIAERAAADPSATVRRGVVMGLSWNRKHSDEWAVAIATRALDDRSGEIRRYAQATLDRIGRQRRADEERRQLPDELRVKTERHPGKWVAVADGRIVAVDPPPTWKRRHPDARMYFVPPPTQS